MENMLVVPNYSILIILIDELEGRYDKVPSKTK